MLSFANPGDNVVVADVTLHSSPGMGLLAFDCTNIRLERVRNTPVPTAVGVTPFPLAGNADAMHLASCRGEVTVRGCVANRQGDDGLNIHGQYAIVVQSVRAGDTVQVTVGPRATSDNTSWGVIFARPVFRVGDTVAVRSPSRGLEDVASEATVLRVSGDGSAPPLVVTLGGVDGATLVPGDIVESLSAVPSTVVVSNNLLANSRASGIIMESNNVQIQNNWIQNLSSAGIASGGYFTSFAESPFGSNITIVGNQLGNVGLGHRTTSGGHWGAGGGAIQLSGSNFAPNATALHRNVTVSANIIMLAGGGDAPKAAALQAVAVTGLSVENNTILHGGAGAGAGQSPLWYWWCKDVVAANNSCCDGDGAGCKPCPD